MEVLKVLISFLTFFVFVLLPVQFKALIVLITDGREAWKEYRRKWFASMVNELSIEHNRKTKHIKTKLFENLARIESKDPKLRAQGKIRIMEVGIGGGANLQYYPSNCHVVAVDYNPAFEKIVLEKMKQYPEMTLEAFHITSATDMSCVPSESVDVVITTVVLCSIKDVQGVIKEVHRVLVPGGRYLYMEHILEESNTTLNRIQSFLSKFRIWSFFFDGCDFKPLDKIFKKNSPFSSTKQENVYIDTKGLWIFQFIHTHVSGVQIK